VLRGDDCKEAPLSRDALQLVGALVGELDTRPDDEVFDGARNEHLSRTGERSHPRADADRDTPDIVADELALTCV